jgi:hypothetical protein
MIRRARLPMVLVSSSAVLLAASGAKAREGVTRAEVERAIRDGVRFLLEQQDPKRGEWPGQPGTTALAALALMTAGESPDSPAVASALRAIGRVTPEQLNNTYAVGLQAMALSAANPIRFQKLIAHDAAWLERGQIRRGGTVGAWTYNPFHGFHGDNSNTQYALLGLNAAREAGIPIDPRTWALARAHWQGVQGLDGSWSYQAAGRRGGGTGSMTCAGISSLVIAEMELVQGHEELVGDEIRNCGHVGVNPTLQRAIDWMATNFSVVQNPGVGQQWTYYYLYGLERAGRLTGLRYFGDHDWYREGAEELVRRQDRLSGSWAGDNGPVVTTSFALLFLAKGRSPVLINKLRHGPARDWDNDRDDVRDLVASVSRDWGHLLTWQTVDPSTATVEDLLQAPILLFNGHEAPTFSAQAKRNLREYVEQGGFILADACCGRREFDRGFRALMEEVFPEPQYALHELAEDHAVWRCKYVLSPDVHPLWGIEHGCRTVVIYSPQDLSCYWNHLESEPQNPRVIKAQRVGQNIVDYATGREMPADKLEVREVSKLALDRPRRGALYIAKLKHAGDWNIAPMAIPNLTNALRADPLKFDVVINHKAIAARDPNLVNFPLLYIHGRAAMSLSEEDLAALRRHLEPGGGTLFADAACGSQAFDASFRKLLAALLPDHPLVPIPSDDPLYTSHVGYDLSHVEFSKAAGGRRGFPQLEGIRLNGHWAVIYSKYDLGCALESHQGPDCKGYTHESALKIAANIVIYATLP